METEPHGLGAPEPAEQWVDGRVEIGSGSSGSSLFEVSFLERLDE